jgi:hypothetical protein
MTVPSKLCILTPSLRLLALARSRDLSTVVATPTIASCATEIVLIGLLTGAAAFLFAHAIEAARWDWFGPAHEPWFLNSGRALVFTALCLVAAGALAGRSLRDGVYVAAGATVALIVVLFLTGPGALFPIVMFMGAGVVVLSIVAGVRLRQVVKRSG